MSVAATLVALTPNLALDRTLRLDRPLLRGSLHRVQESSERAGGKGVNLARAVHALGGDPVVAGFLAGWNGRKFKDLLQSEGIAGVFEDVAGETRECHALLDGGDHPTEVNEAGPTVPASAWTSLLARLPSGQLVLSGSLPPGVGGDEFVDLVARLPERPVVDMSGAALSAAVKAGAAMVAPNRREFAALLERDTATIDDAIAFYETHGVPVLLSLGADGAAFLGEDRWRVRAPDVRAVNPVGSGDCLLGAFLWARGQGHDAGEALRWGVAAGSDNARRGGGGAVSADGIRELFALTAYEEVH
ncbi:MAG: 1-phosphofructokinase family hexose kinase [Trueperaceae bacterium]